MMWASAMSSIKGKNYNYMLCCLGAQCCPSCTFLIAYMDLTKHYEIEDKMIYCKCCLPVLSLYQTLDTVLVKEGLKMTMGGTASRVDGARRLAAVDIDPVVPTRCPSLGWVNGSGWVSDAERCTSVLMFFGWRAFHRRA